MVVPGHATQTYQAQIDALKAVANLVEVDHETFNMIVRSREHPTIVGAVSGVLWFRKQVYLTSYDGFVFVLRSERELDFKAEAPGAFYVSAKSVNIPFL